MELVNPRVLARAFGVNETTLYKWLKRNPELRVRENALAMLKDWKVSLTPTQAARILSVSTSKMDLLIREGKVETVQGPVRRRVLKSSVKNIEGKQRVIPLEYVVQPEKRGFARLHPEKLREISKLAFRPGAASRRSTGTRIYSLRKRAFFEKLEQPLRLEGRESLNLQAAAELFGVSRQAIRRWMRRYGIQKRRVANTFQLFSADLQLMRSMLREELKEELDRRRDHTLIEVGEAAAITGFPVYRVLQMFYRKALDGKLVDDRPKIYRASAEYYAYRNKVSA